MQSKLEKNDGNIQLRGHRKEGSQKGKESWRNEFNKSTIQDFLFIFLFIRSLIFLSLCHSDTYIRSEVVLLEAPPSYSEQKLVKENCSFNQIKMTMIRLRNQSVPIMARYKLDASFNRSYSQTRRDKRRDPRRRQHERRFRTSVTSFEFHVGNVVLYNRAV